MPYFISDPLGISFPKSVQIAICIGCNRLITRGEQKLRFWFITWLQVCHLVAFLCLEMDPLDEVLRQHGMCDAADAPCEGMAYSSVFSFTSSRYFRLA